MGVLDKLWHNRWIIRALIPSVIFNFRHLPFSQAARLPILLRKARLRNCSGKFIFNCPVRFGLVKFGVNNVSLYPDSGISLENRGTIVFNGYLSVGNASAISVDETGVLEFGEKVIATSSLKIACYHSIKLNDNILIGWDCMMIDTDFHKLKYTDQKRYSKGYGSIAVGSNTWVANNCKLYKNSTIPENCVIGADTIIHGPVDCQPYSLITTEISTIVKTVGIYHDKDDDEINIIRN